MKVDWQILKKRGNFRPTLTYTITLEPFEKKLAVHAVWVESHIPEIPNPSQRYCLPGENERSPVWIPSEFHRLQVPFFKIGERRDFMRLPFRESGEYPEVESSFLALRNAYETVVKTVYGKEPIHQRGALDMSPETRTCVAARVTADRLLNLFEPASETCAASAFIGKKTG